MTVSAAPRRKIRMHIRPIAAVCLAVVLFWTIVATLIGLLVTGIVLWFDTDWRIAAWIVQLSGVVHALCAFALFMGIFVHIYMATLMIRGSMRAMVRGYVKPHWAYHHHPRWYRRVTGRQAPPGH